MPELSDREAKSPIAVPAEIWIRVLRHLQQPKCAPLSLPPRAALSQHALTVAARVCRLWEKICNTLIYQTLTVRDFPALLEYIHLPSFRQRLSSTRALYIEYDSLSEDPTYYGIIKTGGRLWARFAEDGMDTYLQAEADVSLLLPALKRAVKFGGVKTLFPNLKTVAVSSIYGREHPVWEGYRPEEDRGRTSTTRIWGRRSI